MTRGPLPGLVESILIEGELPAQSPRLVISSGGKTAHVNVNISRRYFASNIFIGVPPHISAHHFSAIMHTEDDWAPENGMRMDLLPTRLSPAAAREKCEAFRAELGLGNQRLCAMLIGGDSRGHKFRPDEWKALAEGMNELASANGFKWLVTTSRRTGAEAEMIVRAVLDPSLVADATWWASRPRPVVVPYLGVSDIVFCTHDSRTMISEGVASGKPLYALLPDKIPGEGFHTSFVNQHEEGQHLRRVRIASMGTIDLAGDVSSYFKGLSADVMGEMTDRLIALLDRQTPPKLNRSKGGGVTVQ
jgi:hypothetical protein